MLSLFWVVRGPGKNLGRDGKGEEVDDGGSSQPATQPDPGSDPPGARWRRLPMGCRKRVTRASLSPARVQQLETKCGPDGLGWVTRESSVSLEKFICIT